MKLILIICDFEKNVIDVRLRKIVLERVQGQNSQL